MNVRPIKTCIFKEGEDLVAFITKHVPKLKNGSVLVVTSKIVALSEGRVGEKKDIDKFIKEESEWALPTRVGTLTFKDDILMWNAGIDSSNADGKIVLLPKNSFDAAASIRTILKKHYKIKKLGVVLSDSRIMPLRAGVVGIALGYAGFRGTRNYRGKKDLFGRTYRLTQTDIADSLASAAILVMGEGAERQPLAVIEDAPVEFTERVNRTELLIPLEEDMYRPLFKRVSRKKRR